MLPRQALTRFCALRLCALACRRRASASLAAALWATTRSTMCARAAEPSTAASTARTRGSMDATCRGGVGMEGGQ